jgi:hypothetical protein
MAISLSLVAPTIQEIVNLFHSASFRTPPVVEEAVRRRRPSIPVGANFGTANCDVPAA